MKKLRKGQPFATKLIVTNAKKTKKIGRKTYKTQRFKQDDLHCWVHADGMRCVCWYDNTPFALVSSHADTKKHTKRKRRHGKVRVP